MLKLLESSIVSYWMHHLSSLPLCTLSPDLIGSIQDFYWTFMELGQAREDPNYSMKISCFQTLFIERFDIFIELIGNCH